MRRLDAIIAAHSGTATLKLVDLTAKRYALWSVRRKFDWNKGPFIRRAPEGVRVMDRNLCDGIWNLDVTLRRRVEALLTAESQEPPEVVQPRAGELREEVEKQAGALAASIDMRGMVGDVVEYWDEIAKDFDAVYKELDGLLTQAGAPQSAG
jgi:hypothetical protein